MLRFVVLQHGSPKIVISVRGWQYVADMVEEMLRLCSSNFLHSTPYHAQRNGLMDWNKRTLTKVLSIYVASDHKNWDDVPPFSIYAYNIAQRETTGYRPFFILYARPPRYTLETIFPFYTTMMLLHSRSCAVQKKPYLLLICTLSFRKIGRRHVLYIDADMRHIIAETSCCFERQLENAGCVKTCLRTMQELVLFMTV